MLENKLFDVLVCPKTKGALEYHKNLAELWSREAKLAYPVRDGLPKSLKRLRHQKQIRFLPTTATV